MHEERMGMVPVYAPTKAGVGVSNLGNDLTSGGDSSDSSDVIYPAYGPCFLGGGNGDFSGVGNGPP